MTPFVSSLPNLQFLYVGIEASPTRAIDCSAKLVLPRLKDLFIYTSIAWTSTPVSQCILTLLQAAPALTSLSLSGRDNYAPHVSCDIANIEPYLPRVRRLYLEERWCEPLYLITLTGRFSEVESVFLNFRTKGMRRVVSRLR